MSAICHRDHCRGFQHLGRCCGHGISTTDILSNKFHFNKWFTSHVHYTAAFVSRLFMPDAQRIVKRILPSSITSSSHEDPVDGDDDSEASSDDACSSSDHAGDMRDIELEEFQNEVRDFIKNLRSPAASTLSVSTVTDVTFAHSILTSCVIHIITIPRFDMSAKLCKALTLPHLFM